MASFENLGVQPELIAAIDEMGWQLPRAVQAEAIPLILGGGDVMIASETGSGKTGAFVIPVLQLVAEEDVLASATPTQAPAALTVTKDSFWNPEFSDSEVVLSAEGRMQSRNDRAWKGVRCQKGANSGAGLVYYEATVLDDGLCRFGWATSQAGYNIGSDNQSFGYGGTAMCSHDKKYTPYGEVYSRGDVIGCLLDRNKHVLSFSKNGVLLGQAFSLPSHLHNQPLYPACVLKNAEALLNIGPPTAIPTPNHTVSDGNHQFKNLKYLPSSHLPVSQLSSSHASTHPSNSPKHQSRSSDSKDTPRSNNGGGKKSGKNGGKKVSAVIIEPSWELADQVHTEIESLKTYISPAISHALLTGGEAGPE